MIRVTGSAATTVMGRAAWPRCPTRKYSDDKRDSVWISTPKIHQSVFSRIAVDAHLYAPVALPPAYEILTYEEKIVPPEELGYETPHTAITREEIQEKVVGSSIWRRRIIYFLTVIASVYVLAYPWNSQLPASAEFITPLRPLSDLIHLVFIPLPHAADRWENAYARDPLHLILCGGLVGLLLWLSASLKGRITDQMRWPGGSALGSSTSTRENPRRRPRRGCSSSWSVPCCC